MGLLKGKRALISGVANKKSLAWGIAQAMHRQGARLAFTCAPTNLRRVNKLSAQVDCDLVVPCDVKSDADIEKAIDAIGEYFEGRLDIFVHCIAFANWEDIGGEFIKTSREGWNLALEVSAYSLVAFTRQIRPLLIAANGGAIITLSFGGAEAVVPGYNVMGIAKAALNASVRYLAYDLGPERIRVNAIAPGPVATLSSQVIENFKLALELVEERSPLLRNVSKEDVGTTAVYLASDLSAAITGATIPVDSGMHIMCPPTGPRKTARPQDRHGAGGD